LTIWLLTSAVEIGGFTSIRLGLLGGIPLHGAAPM
jgi:hypothetical protein